MKSTREIMNKIYAGTPGDIPWNISQPPAFLVNLIESNIITPCKTIDLGCGRGNYSCYLAEKGFKVTGVDFSTNAIAAARQTALARGAICKFIQLDMISELPNLNEQFDFALEWEILHHIFPEDRESYLNNVSKILQTNALYFAVHFAEGDPFFGGEGKFRTTPIGTTLYFSSLEECETLYKKYFSIIELKYAEIPAAKGKHKVIYALLQKKN